MHSVALLPTFGRLWCACNKNIPRHVRTIRQVSSVFKSVHRLAKSLSRIRPDIVLHFGSKERATGKTGISKPVNEYTAWCRAEKLRGGVSSSTPRVSTHLATHSSSLLRERAPARSSEFNEATAYGVITKLAKRSSSSSSARFTLARGWLEPVRVVSWFHSGMVHAPPGHPTVRARGMKTFTWVNLDAFNEFSARILVATLAPLRWTRSVDLSRQANPPSLRRRIGNCLPQKRNRTILRLKRGNDAGKKDAWNSVPTGTHRAVWKKFSYATFRKSLSRGTIRTALGIDNFCG